MKLLILAASLLLPASAPPAPPPAAPHAAPARTIMPPGSQPYPFGDMPNAFTPGAADCPSIRQQVEIERNRVRPREDGRRLNEEPLALGFLAVERRVDGCRAVTFLNGETRR